MMDDFIVVFSSMFGSVIEKFAEKTIFDPISEKLKKPFQDWLNKNHETKIRQVIFKKSFQEALSETKGKFDTKKIDLLLSYLNLEKLESKQIIALASSSITIQGGSASFLPPELINLLSWDNDIKDVVAHFLFSLKLKLIKESQFAPVILYTEAVEQTKLQTISSLYHLSELAKGFYTNNETEALLNYLMSIRKKVSYSTIPITRTGVGVADVELKDIFVPLRIKNKSKENTKIISSETSSKVNNYVETKLSGYTKEYVFDGGESLEKTTNEFDILDVFAEKKNFILLGTPGRGKTTVLRKATLSYIEKMELCLENGIRDFIFPIFFRVRNFGVFLNSNDGKYITPTHASVIQYLDNEYRNSLTTFLTTNFFHNILLQGGCAIMMDGIDEVSENIDSVSSHLKAFIEYYSKNEVGLNNNVFGLSSRPASYSIVKETVFRGGFLEEYEVQPLNIEGVKQLIINVLNIGVLVEQLRNDDIQKLTKVIVESKELFVIASNPLFCTALILVYKVRGAELPQRIVDVFHEIVDLLLGFWRNLDRIDYHKPEESAKEDGLETPFDDVEHSVERKKQRLSCVAYNMQFQEGDKSEILATDAIAILKAYFIKNEDFQAKDAEYAAKKFLKNSHEKSGVLVEIGSSPKKYTFLHNQFREFLAANEVLISNTHDEIVSIVMKNICVVSWEEIIIFIVSHKEMNRRLRESIIDKCIEEAEYQNEVGNVENWSRYLYMAGSMCINSFNYLQPKYLSKIREILYNTMIDESIELTKRYKSGLNLDRLGWSPTDIYCFKEIPQSILQPSRLIIGKYPVSNMQYNRFINSNDYKNSEVWRNIPFFDLSKNGKLSFTEDGFDWFKIQSKNEFYPSEWFDLNMGKLYRNLPVIGINWFEANAYCNWLLKNWNYLEESIMNSEVRPKLIRLPNESEWIEAAGGLLPEHRYPWDVNINDETTKNNIQLFSNINLNNLNSTSPLGMFPRGVSIPYDLVDMCGNVWEWQSNYFDVGNKDITIKGGSYKTNAKDAKVSNRGWKLPNDRDNEIGFRVIIEL